MFILLFYFLAGLIIVCIRIIGSMYNIIFMYNLYKYYAIMSGYVRCERYFGSARRTPSGSALGHFFDVLANIIIES